MLQVALGAIRVSPERSHPGAKGKPVAELWAQLLLHWEGQRAMGARGLAALQRGRESSEKARWLLTFLFL